MLQQIYTVYDKAADAYLQPFYAVNETVALRSFTAACLDESHNFHKYAEDFSLHYIGTYDDSDAHIESERKFITSAEQVLLDASRANIKLTEEPPNA